MAMIEPSAVCGFAEPVARLEAAEGERAEHVVQKPVVAVVDEPPQERDDDDRDHHRHEIDRPEDVDAAQALVDQQRQQQRQPGLYRRHDQHEGEGVDQRLHEHHIAGQHDLGVVARLPARTIRACPRARDSRGCCG